MTKSVRIENADTAPYRIKVTSQFLDDDGIWYTDSVIQLNNPADLLTLTIWESKRLIIEEV